MANQFNISGIAITLLMGFSSLVFPVSDLWYLDSQAPPRLAFAQLNVGLDMVFVPQSGSVPDALGNTLPYPSALMPRVTIGGYHFWGLTDIYVSFPISHSVSNQSGNSFNYDPGVETGIKIMPVPLQPNHISPFVGAAWRASAFQLNQPGSEGPKIVRNEFPIMAGLIYPTQYGVIEGGVSTLLNSPNINYPYSKTEFKTITLPRHFAWMGYKAVFDATRNSPNQNQTGKAKNAWMFGIGPSSAFQLSNSPFNGENRAYLKEDSGITVFPEFGIGYYFDEADFAVNLSYRSITFSNQAFGDSQTRNRNSLALEAYKFVGDFHGFVPFIGVSIGNENLTVTDTADNFTATRQVIVPSLLFGWDIRPTRYPKFLLRTNMRILPSAIFDFGNGRQFSFNQFEFNFIELVVYPERI